MRAMTDVLRPRVKTRNIAAPLLSAQEGPRGPYTQANCGACRMDASDISEEDATRAVLHYVGRYPEGHVYLGRCARCGSEVKRVFAEAS